MTASLIRKIVDSALEFPIGPSFTRIGHDVRSVVEGWKSPEPDALAGKTVVLTGGTSGIGRAAATELASIGARVIITGRNLERTEAAAAEIGDAAGGVVTAEAADMGELEHVRALAERLAVALDAIDVLIHNAGALTDERRVTSAGSEATVASQVYGPFLLTSLLLDQLSAGRINGSAGRVLTMASGGMYSSMLRVDGLEMKPDNYKGAEQYARAKRAQVTLNEMWPDRIAASEPPILFHSLHPGWVDTPGVAEALPTFGKVLGPLLRPPSQGADTLTWLATAPADELRNGRFWHDRGERSLHRLAQTEASDSAERRERLWERVASTAGIDSAAE